MLARCVTPALAVVAVAAPAVAFPEGAPWVVTENKAVCATCHFGGDVVSQSRAITIDGLPPAIEAGEIYRLIVVLDDKDMARAGFMLSVEAGRLAGEDDRVVAKDGRARSTLAGSTLTAKGRAVWKLRWDLPRHLRGREQVLLRIYANAANDDDSPFGDVIHQRRLIVPVKAER